MANCKTIAISNQKGGVGKTTTAISLSVGLAKQGKKVLLCDLDAQGSASISLGFNDLENDPITMAELLQLSIECKEIPYRSEYVKHVEGIDLIPCNIKLAGVENALTNIRFNRDYKLKAILSTLKSYYDYIVIDCPPSLSMLPINALVAADSVLIPLQAQHLATAGLVEFLNTIKMIRSEVNKSIYIEGILITMIVERTNMAKNVISAIREAYGDEITIYDSMIPMSIKASEATSHGKSIYEYDSKSKVALAYENFTKEFLTYGR